MGQLTSDGSGGGSSTFGKYQQTFTATAGQTVFNLSNDIAALDMVTVMGYNNPALIPTAVLTGAAQITFAVGFAENDEVALYWHE